jgi:hypothetical protein
MAGNSNCTWHWSSKPGDRKPGVPWCGFFFPNLTPVNITEAAALRRYAGLPDNAILLNGFDSIDALPQSAVPPDAGFMIFTNGKLGELRHEGEREEHIVFDALIEKSAYVVQVFFRLDNPGAKTGMEFVCDKNNKAFLSVICSVNNVQLTLEENKILSLSKEIHAGEMHSLKIAFTAEGIVKVFVDDLCNPAFEITAEPALAVKIALIAAGKAAFDDLGAVYCDK